MHVRKQYHFWPGEHGRDAWDVDRLIEFAVGRPVNDIELTEIWEIDSPYWFQFEETPTVRAVADHARLMEEADLSHPIILGPDGRVMDGMHRVAKALMEGRETIKAVRLGHIPEDFRNCKPEDLPYGD